MLCVIQGLHPSLAADVGANKPQTLAQLAKVFEPKYASEYKSALGNPHITAYEAEKKPKLAEYNEKKFAAAPCPRFSTISGSKIPYAKPHKPSNSKPRAKPNAGNEKSEIKQYTRAIINSKKKANLCYKYGEKWTPMHWEV